MSTTLPRHINDLHHALLLVDKAPLECDGHTMMISNALLKASIPHERILGKVSGMQNDFCFSPHFWIKLDAFIIDYRLKMWVNLIYGESVSKTAPHGIFPANSVELNYLYEGLFFCPTKLLGNDILNFISEGYSNKLTIPETTISSYKRYSHDSS